MVPTNTFASAQYVGIHIPPHPDPFAFFLQKDWRRKIEPRKFLGDCSGWKKSIHGTGRSKVSGERVEESAFAHSLPLALAPAGREEDAGLAFDVSVGGIGRGKRQHKKKRPEREGTWNRNRRAG